MKKKWKLDMDEALSKLPEEEREEMRKIIEEEFADPEKAIANSKPVIMLEGSALDCPGCKSPLKAEHTLTLPEEVGGPLGGKVVESMYCKTCDTLYMREALS